MGSTYTSLAPRASAAAARKRSSSAAHCDFVKWARDGPRVLTALNTRSGDRRGVARYVCQQTELPGSDPTGQTPDFAALHRLGTRPPQPRPLTFRLSIRSGRLWLAPGCRRSRHTRAVPEAPLDDSGSGLAPAGAFRSQKVEFPQFGIRLHVLEPGEPNGLYHSESEQEAFLVLSGECTGVRARLAVRRERGGGDDRPAAGVHAVRAVTAGAALVLGPPPLGLALGSVRGARFPSWEGWRSWLNLS
jgi:hypothetical protein